MEPVRWEPTDYFRRLQEQMDRFFDETGRIPERGWWGRSLTPAIDLFQTDTELVATAELPGLEPGDLEITVTDVSLNLKGQTKRRDEVKDEGVYRTERRFGSFYRSLPLPVEVDSTKARAEYKNGVLEVRIPKKESTRIRKLTVDFH